MSQDPLLTISNEINRVANSLRTSSEKLYHALDAAAWALVQDAGELRITKGKAGQPYGPGIYLTPERKYAEQYIKPGGVLLEIDLTSLISAVGKKEVSYFPAGTLYRGFGPTRGTEVFVTKDIPVDKFTAIPL